MRALASLSLLFNALVWGLSWWPLRYLQHNQLHPLWATMCFFALGVVILLIWRPCVLGDLKRQPALIAIAVVSGFTNATFNWGVAIGDVVRVVLLFYLMPLWAALLARIVLREAITWASSARMVLALGGAALVLKPAGHGWPAIGSLADLLGLLGGMGFALTNVLLRQQAALPAASRAFSMFAGCTALPGLLAWGLSQSGVVSTWPTFAWAWGGPVLLMGVIFFFSNLALQYGAAHLPVKLTSVLMLTEVLFASASSAWVGESTLTPMVLMGGGLIVFAALMATLGESS
ncbi:MAG TPA: DMT family transporter [Aquabacterium sp.]|nr:DMT family transporter [Aquabacterium sp.]